MKNTAIILISCLFVFLLSSCFGDDYKKPPDEIYYGNDSSKSVSEAETVNYDIKNGKLITDNYSFDIPAGYFVNNNVNFISMNSNFDGPNILIQNVSGNDYGIAEYIAIKEREIIKTGYEISTPLEIEINEKVITELKVGLPGKVEDDPVGIEYIYYDSDKILSVTMVKNGISSINSEEADDLLKQINLILK